MLEPIAEAEGISLSQLPRASVAYLREWLASGTHTDAMIRSGISAADYYTARRSGQFQALCRAVRAAIDHARTEIVDDRVFEGSASSEKLLMFHAERRDPRYAPPNSRQQGDGSGGISIQLNIVAPGYAPQAVTVAGSSRVIDVDPQSGDQTATKTLPPAQNAPIMGGFLGGVMGLQPSAAVPQAEPATIQPSAAPATAATAAATAQQESQATEQWQGGAVVSPSAVDSAAKAETPAERRARKLAEKRGGGVRG